MITPKMKEMEELARNYKRIPICKEIYADVLTPISLLRRIARSYDRCFLLESIEGGEKWARYSFLGFQPIIRIFCKNHVVTLEKEGVKTIVNQKPYEALRELMQKYHAPKQKDMPPFTGGLVGYFAYGMIGYVEPALELSESDCNDYDFMLFDKVIAYDHLKQKISIVVNIKTDDLPKRYKEAEEEISKLKALITREDILKKTPLKSNPHFHCNLTKEEFCAMVDETKKKIVDGDIFQAVISRKFETQYEDSLLHAYRVLRTTNPSPYMVFIQCDDMQIISTSPETLVKLQNGKVTTFPVAGSRPRGATPEQDMQLETELLQDEKELAEHNMLVDLGRNDIGKISKISTVAVTEYMRIHKYSKIMHICSEVQGEIQEGMDGFDAVKAILPAGTLSGAPKIRACEIIEQTEKESRGIYGGALGYIDFTGNLDTCIAIRMAVKKGNKVTVQAGGGIVADSVPEKEYLESENKAKAIMQAVMRAGEVED